MVTLNSKCYVINFVWWSDRVLLQDENWIFNIQYLAAERTIKHLIFKQILVEWFLNLFISKKRIVNDFCCVFSKTNKNKWTKNNYHHFQLFLQCYIFTPFDPFRVFPFFCPFICLFSNGFFADDMGFKEIWELWSAIVLLFMYKGPTKIE